MNRAFKGALVGAISGAVGTGAMDLVWYRRFRKGGGDQGFYAWETGKSIKGWDEVSDPGKVRELIARKAVGHVPDDLPGQNSTSGGSSESAANAWQAKPTGLPSSRAAMTVTPEAKCPSA